MMLEFCSETPDCPTYVSFPCFRLGKHTLMIGQDHHEAALRSHLQKLGCVVKLGTELILFEVKIELIPDGKQADLIELLVLMVLGLTLKRQCTSCREEHAY